MAVAGRLPMLGSPLGLLLVLVVLLQLVQPAAAFGAGNIASISRIEGKNWRHGDIEDTLKTLAFIKGHKWTSMMVKRVYFGNWLRDYSQAVDVGTLKGVQAESIRILLWVLSFLTFGYATAEFEVTAERLGCYRPEEHIDNPRNYADNKDARQYDARLRPPVQQIELEIDPETGMKNYIANERIGIATSSGYVKHSLTRSIHYGRMYRHGSGSAKGREQDLCEALRCLGQALHCCEDFGAHSNYCELALREMGHRNVFPHCGANSEINLCGNRVFPIVTGTFGGVDFLHSVLGEANDHFTQSEVDELDKTLATAQVSGHDSSRGFEEGGDDSADILIGLLSQIPGTGDLGQQARELHAVSQQQEAVNAQRGFGGSGGFSDSGDFQSSRGMTDFDGSERATFPGSNVIPAGVQNVDPAEVIKKIYPILAFRDHVVKALSKIIEKIPGLEVLVEKITETVTLFVLRLMAPFVRPVIDLVSKQLKAGSSVVVDASGQHQYEPWTDPNCTDPTHSLLSKDHFTNILNEPAGQVASQILKYVVPRVLWAWEHPDAPLDQIMADVVKVFHHPAVRDMSNEVHRAMFGTVEAWSRRTPHNLDDLLSSDGVRHGRNQIDTDEPHTHGGSAMGAMQNMFGQGGLGTATSSLSQNNSAWSMIEQFSKMTGGGGGSLGGLRPGMSSIPGISREADFEGEAGIFGEAFPGTETQYDRTRPPPGPGVEFGGSYGGQSPYAPNPFGYETGPQHASGYEAGYQGPLPLQYGYGAPSMGFASMGGAPMGGPPPGQYGGYGDGYYPNMPPSAQGYPSQGYPPQGYPPQQGYPPEGGYQGGGGGYYGGY